MLTLLGLGVLGNGIYQFFFVEGIAHTSASDTALVVAASPAFIAIIGRVRGVERISAGRDRDLSVDRRHRARRVRQRARRDSGDVVVARRPLGPVRLAVVGDVHGAAQAVHRARVGLSARRRSR